jgi:hypothetical protein
MLVPVLNVTIQMGAAPENLRGRQFRREVRIEMGGSGVSERIVSKRRDCAERPSGR